MRLGYLADPRYMAKRLGFVDAVPNALARTTGALSLVRNAVQNQPPPVAPTPYTVLCALGSSKVMKYVDPNGGADLKHKTPIFLVPSLINRPYILDIKDGLSVVQALQERGYAVYCVDWGDPGLDEDTADLATYVIDRLGEFVKAIAADAGVEKVHLLGQCLGGTMTTILAALDDSHIQSMVNLTAPISFHDTGMLSAWSRAPFFDEVAFADAYGHVPSWITQPSFVVLKPAGSVSKWLRLVQNLGKPSFVDFFQCLEAWINDNVDIPKGFYIDLIGQLYKKDALVRGSLKLRDRHVVLEEITVPTFTIAASEDHIVPVASAMVGHHRISSDDRRQLVIQGGHIGVVVGGRGRRILHQALDEWFGARSEPVAGPAPKKAKDRGGEGEAALA